MAINLCRKIDQHDSDYPHFWCMGSDQGQERQKQCSFFVEFEKNNGRCFYNPHRLDECTCPAARYFLDNVPHTHGAEPLLKGRYVTPICPFCRSKMQVIMYKGFYESFAFWGCDCKDSELEPNIAMSFSGYSG